ncbi:MAG: cobaltochelatase CobT [Oleiphilaceae bacterium]|jgi:cobaltochelatase CobT
MDLHVQKFIQRAKNIAPLLSGRDDIKVTISGSGAYSSGGHINLPMGDFTCPDWVAMTRGWIDHELGHEKHTCHSNFKKAAEISQSLKNILNSLEDARMENKVGNEFPGAKSNLLRLVNLAIEKSLFCEPDESNSIRYFILYYARRHVTGQFILNEYADRAEQLCRETLGDNIVDKLKALIESTSKAKDTSDVYAISLEIHKLLEEEKDSNDDSSDDSDDDSSDDSGDSDGDSSDDSDDDSSDGSGDSDDDSSDDSDGGSSDDSVGDTSGGKSIAKEAIEQFLNDENEYDYHELIQDMIEQDSDEFQQSDDQEDGHGDYSGYDIDVRKTCLHLSPSYGVINEGTLVSRFYRTLNRVFVDKTRSMPISRNRGVNLINNKLAGVPAGHMNVFKNASLKTEIVSDVSILVDASGSMSTETMQEASRTAFSLSKALGRMKIDSQVSYYGCWDYDKARAGLPGNYLYVAKDFKQTLQKARFSPVSNGSTPTHEAMHYAIMSLALKRSNNKIVFVITDGQPNDASEVIKMADVGRKMGVKFVPIGLGVNCVQGFNEDEYITAVNSDAVNDALQKAIKLRLFA